MRRSRRPVRFAGAASALLLAALAAPGAAMARPPVCDASTALTLVGLDTRSGTMLLSFLSGGEIWYLEAAAGSETAALLPGRPAGGRFSGSIGPGPVFTLVSCGDGCLGAEVWQGGNWQSEGGSLPVAASANTYTTYDGAGRPWVVVHSPAGGGGRVAARGFRLVGESWEDRGSLRVEATGSPGAAPAPFREDAVVTGTGLLGAEGRPEPWLTGLPALPGGRSGHVVPVGERGAFMIGDAGGLYLSSDGGATWRQLRWKPWGITAGDPWSYPEDFGLEIPQGSLAAPLPLAWFDRRPGREAGIVLSELSAAGDFTLLAALPPVVDPGFGEPLEITHLLRTEGGTWVLVAGCGLRDGASVLVLRTASPGGLSPPRLLPIERLGR